MRSREFIKESMDFNACSLEGNRITPHNWREAEVDCHICDGNGWNEYPTDETRTKFEKEECGYCRGTGKDKTHICDGPQMNVSNENGGAIIRDILGQEFDYVGMVEKKDMPALRRKLIKMLNMDSERTSMHLDPTDNKDDRPMQRRTDDDGNSSIGRGARVIGGGRTDDQVLRYADQMLKMVEYAMEHDLVISWG